jgi:hypothetical protein
MTRALCAPTDKTGKVFVVVEHGMRRCLICEEWFTQAGSRQHANAVCHPQTRSPTLPINLAAVGRYR